MSRKLRKTLERDLDSMILGLKQVNGPKREPNDMKWIAIAEKIVTFAMALFNSSG